MFSNSTKDRILGASIRLFGKIGYERVSIRQIASAVGIKESSIYNHYASKDDILYSIMDVFRQLQRSYWPSMEEFRRDMLLCPVEEMLGRFFYPYKKEEYGYMLYMHRILFMEQYRNERLSDIFTDYLMGQQFRLVKNAFDSMVDAGLLLPFDTDSITRVWFCNNTAAALEACQDTEMIDRAIDHPGEFEVPGFGGHAITCMDLVLQYLPGPETAGAE